MRRRVYRAVAIATIIACLVFVFFTWYVVGIVEKNNSKTILEGRLMNVCEIFSERKSEYENVISQLCNDYKSRSRSLAMLLAKNTNILSDDVLLEEIRMSVGADDIIVFDDMMNIDFTTGSTLVDDEILEKFKPALGNKQFSMAEIYYDEKKPKIIVGVSRMDKTGIIQVEYSSDNINSIMEITDVSGMFMNISIMQTGCLAVIEGSDMTYSAHTDSDMIGKPSHLSFDDELSEESGFFDHEINGEDVLAFYIKKTGRVIIGYIPYSEIYYVRNDTIKWVVAAGVVIAFVVTLTIRTSIFHIGKKEKKK